MGLCHSCHVTGVNVVHSGGCMSRIFLNTSTRPIFTFGFLTMSLCRNSLFVSLCQPYILMLKKKITPPPLLIKKTVKGQMF